MRRKNVIHHATRDVGLGGHQDEDPGRLLHVGFAVWICPSVPDAERDEIGWGRQSGAKRQACRKDGRGFETEMDPLTTETKSECCRGWGSSAGRLHHHLLQYFTIIIRIYRWRRRRWRSLLSLPG